MHPPKQRAAGLRILSQDALLPCLVYPDALPFTRPPKPCMKSRAHRRTRARHDTSGLGTVIRISLSAFRQVRRRTRSHPGSTPHAPPKRLKHPVDPPCGRAGPRFASTTTRLAPRRARPRGGRVHRGVALSRTASTKRKDRACKAVSCFAHTQSLGVELVLQHTTVISPNLIARPSRNRSEFAIVSEESKVATTESLVSTRVSRGKFVATGRIHSTLRDRPPFCDGYCSAQKTG